MKGAVVEGTLPEEEDTINKHVAWLNEALAEYW